jgi:hypothetical protein
LSLYRGVGENEAVTEAGGLGREDARTAKEFEGSTQVERLEVVKQNDA